MNSSKALVKKGIGTLAIPVLTAAVLGILCAANGKAMIGNRISFTAFLPMFIGGYIGRFSNEKLGFLLAALCMSMLNSTFAAFSNEISASMQSIINAVLLVVFLIYLSNEHKIAALLHPIRK